MKTRALAVAAVLLTLVVGCAGNRQTTDANGDYIAPVSIYSVMDSTSLVYTDVAAGAALNDHPLRWTAFILHPVGQGLDYGLNRPFYKVGGSAPYLFGYTSEDSMLDTQRR